MRDFNDEDMYPFVKICMYQDEKLQNVHGILLFPIFVKYEQMHVCIYTEQ